MTRPEVKRPPVGAPKVFCIRYVLCMICNTLKNWGNETNKAVFRTAAGGTTGCQPPYAELFGSDTDKGALMDFWERY